MTDTAHLVLKNDPHGVTSIATTRHEEGCGVTVRVSRQLYGDYFSSELRVRRLPGGRAELNWSEYRKRDGNKSGRTTTGHMILTEHHVNTLMAELMTGTVAKPQ